jgi:hypothetical protein
MNPLDKRNTLVFPDGVRLARLDELPGPEPARIEASERIKSANICPGFCAKSSDDARFSIYAEANVDAPHIWNVFVSLSKTLLGDNSSLLIGNIDEQLSSVGPFLTSSLLELLGPHRYQLTNDGLIQFGLIDERHESIVEILLTPTKHFMVWANDENALRTAFTRHGVGEVAKLRFLDEFPRTIESLSPGNGVTLRAEELVQLLRDGPKQPRH